MFGDGFFGQWRLKLMSAFTTGLVASTSMLSAGNPEVIVKEIKKELKADGISYSYEATEQFDIFSILGDLFKGMPGANGPEAQEGIKLFKMLFNDLGLNDVDGYGSSITKNGEMYDHDYFAHLKAGNEKSLIWKVMGGNESEMTTLKMVPSDAVLSLTFKLDIQSLWKYLKEKAPQVKLPNVELESQLQMLEGMGAQMGTPVEEVAKALTTEFTVVVTMDKSEKMMLPGTPPLPKMSLTFVIKKNGEFLQNYLKGALAAGPVKTSKLEGFQVFTIEEKIPTGTFPGMAYDEEYMILSTEIASLNKFVSAKNGKGLLASSNFSKYSSLGTKGNMALYLSPDVSKTVTDVMTTMPPEASMIATFYSSLFFQDKVPELFLVYSKRPNGIKTDMLSSFRMASAQLQSVAVIGILAAMILPALGKARMKAKQAKSKSRLKQMGTTVAMYYTDGGSTLYPTDLKKFEFDPSILSHPGSDKITTLEDIAKGEGDYIMLFKPGKDAYTGAADKPMFMERPGIWNDGRVNVVFEDGHVSSFFGTTVEEVLEAIKRGY